MPIASKGTTMIMHLTQDRDLRERLREVCHRSFLGVVAVMCIACLVSLKPGDAAGAEVEPTEVIKGTVTELFSILKEFQEPARSQARRLAIERVIRRDVHYEDMAKRSLGVSWAQMDDGVRTAYVGLFVHLLRDALANRMTQYAGERIMYLSERRKATCAEVKTRLVGSKVDTTLDFRLKTHRRRVVGIRRHLRRRKSRRELSSSVCKHYSRWVIGRVDGKTSRENTTRETF